MKGTPDHPLERERIATTLDRIEFGEILKRRRKTLRLTQTALAARIGIDQPALSRVETGQIFPTDYVVAMRVAEYYRMGDADKQRWLQLCFGFTAQSILEPPTLADHVEEWLSGLLSEVRAFSRQEGYAQMWLLIRPALEIGLQQFQTTVWKHPAELELCIQLLTRLGDAARTIGLTTEGDLYYQRAVAAIDDYGRQFGPAEHLLRLRVNIRSNQSSLFYMEVPKLLRFQRSTLAGDLSAEIQDIERWSSALPEGLRALTEARLPWLALRQQAFLPASTRDRRVLAEQFLEAAEAVLNHSEQVSELSGVIRAATGLESVIVGTDAATLADSVPHELRILARQAADRLDQLMKGPGVSELNRIRALKALTLYDLIEGDLERAKEHLLAARRLAVEKLFYHQLSEIETMFYSLLAADDRAHVFKPGSFWQE